MPTPCSPVMEPPARRSSARISSPQARALSSSPGLRASNKMMGCKLPSPAWKMLLIAKPYRCEQAADEVQGGRNLGARHHAVLHIVSGTDAAHGAEGVLAALPQQVALFWRVAPRGLRARAQSRQAARDLLHLFVDGFAHAFEFDEQHGGGVHGVAGVSRLLHHAQHHAVEHFDGDRRDGARR